MFSSHVLNDVEEVADRITVVRQGRNVLSGTIESLLSGQRFELVVREQPASGAWVKTAEGFIVIATMSAAQALLGELTQAQISVLRCQRERRSFEELFFDDFGEGGAS